MTIGSTYSFVATIRDLENYAAPITNALFVNVPQVYINGVIHTIATVDQIPSLSTYAPLASPNFTGNPTVASNPILVRTTTLTPAYYGAGRKIELDVSGTNTA